MTTFVLYIATSLDGYIARADGSVDWLDAVAIEGEDYGYTEFYNTIDALVMGATTYEQVLGFGDWVYAGKPSYVLTHRELFVPYPDITLVQGGLDAFLQRVSEKDYQRVWVVGGGHLASAMMQRGLITDYWLSIIPILLGSGITLFQNVPERSLTLLETTSYPSGVVMLRYGALHVG